ncbi:MAG: hypothetical protein V4488_06965 [Pseudomonadota bacterium]
MIITFEDIFVAAENPGCTSENKNALEGLHRAMNDWPDDFDTVEDFFFSVESYLGEALNSAHVRAKSRMLSALTDAWRGESLSELLAFLDAFGCTSAVEYLDALKRL